MLNEIDMMLLAKRSGGGGGGGNYKEVVLYDNPNGIEFKPNSPQTIQLPESYKNYHALYITTSASNTSNYRDTTVIPTTSISVEDTYYINTYNVGIGYSYPAIRFNSENEMYLYGFDSDTPMKIYKVVGIKYGGGGGGTANVSMSDNPTGGVDLTVNDVSKTLAKQSDLSELNDIIGTGITFAEDAGEVF